MEKVHHAILPGIILGSVLILIVSFWVAVPQIAVAAATEPAPVDVSPEQPAQVDYIAIGPGDECPLAGDYPESVVRWCDSIQRYANEQDLDANLIAAVILQESGGNPDAYSRSGAVGLMQVMPRDGLAASFMCINGPCFADRPSMAELYEPVFNISYGSGYLGSLVRKHGNIRDALMAYGPANIGYSYADTVLSIYNNYQ